MARLLRGFYFGKIPIVGARSGHARQRAGRLIVSSHRNGAIDGYLVLKAFPAASGLVSVQLLRHPLLRWLFDGIPVVRRKDCERCGLSRDAFDDPADLACEHLRAGGDLMIFPEGSSEWGYRPLPYHHGAARIASTLAMKGKPPEIVPVGLHYAAPDRFRSLAEVLVADAVTLPPRQSSESDNDWMRRIHEAIAEALNAVSVNCPDAETFAAVQAEAAARVMAGESYALALIDAQAHPPASNRAVPPAPRHAWPWDWLVVAAFMLMAAPVLLAARLVGGKADARNTVSFFHILGGLPAALLWLPCLGALTWWQPWPLLGLWILAMLGWWRWPRVMHGKAS